MVTSVSTGGNGEDIFFCIYCSFFDVEKQKTLIFASKETGHGGDSLLIVLLNY